MTRRAFHSPMNWKQNLLLTIAMGSAAVLLGCGGGGGGNGGPPPPAGDCGSVSGAGTVVCGFVTAAGTTTGVNGATVRLRNAAGSTIVSGPTQLTAGNNGFYKLVVPAGQPLPTTISVDVPSTGYLPNYLQYKGKNYDSTRTAVAGGPCVPGVVLTANADTRLTDPLVIYSDASAPPPPVFVCPR